MPSEAEFTFQTTGWEEEPYEEPKEGLRLARAKVTQEYEGDVEGEGAVEYLMSYTTATTATFVGLERITGKVGGRSGSFVLQHTGSYENATAESSWRVLAGAGTGELAALRGEGRFIARHGEPATASFSYDFEDEP